MKVLCLGRKLLKAKLTHNKVIHEIENRVLLGALRATERIIGPWGSFNFGPLAYPSLVLYIMSCYAA